MPEQPVDPEPVDPEMLPGKPQNREGYTIGPHWGTDDITDIDLEFFWMAPADGGPVEWYELGRWNGEAWLIVSTTTETEVTIRGDIPAGVTEYWAVRAVNQYGAGMPNAEGGCYSPGGQEMCEDDPSGFPPLTPWVSN